MPSGREQYRPEAFVPDPATIRPCTPAEVAHFVQPLPGNSYERRPTDVLVYAEDNAARFWEAQVELDPSERVAALPQLGETHSLAGELTTTRNNDLANGPNKEGLHLDSHDQYSHRLGVCLPHPAGTPSQRWLALGATSAERLHGRAGQWRSSETRAVLQARPDLLAAISVLLIPLQPLEIYDAYTSQLLHDGSTWLNTTGGSTVAPAPIRFYSLPAIAS